MGDDKASDEIWTPMGDLLDAMTLRLQAACDELRPGRLSPDPTTIAPPFPSPVKSIGKARVWCMAEIRAWAAAARPPALG